MRRACPSTRSRRRQGERRSPWRAWGSRTCQPSECDLLSAFRAHAIVEFDDAIADTLPGEVLGAIACPVSQVHAQPRVEEYPSDSLGQRALVAGRHAQARLAVLYDCLQTAHPPAPYRRTAG